MPHPPRRKPESRPRPSAADPAEVVGVRIIGGRFRGRRLLYSGDPRTRPMKDRVREAVFNLLGPGVAGKHAIDLFAGTGALGIEALSRGAARATFIEQHFPTAELIRRNLATLGAEAAAEVIPGNVFLWFRRRPALGDAPWLVFCSPPYALYVDRRSEMLSLLAGLIAAAPAQSQFVVEADERFDFALLPSPDAWNMRRYPPATIGLWRK
jgi:16S rRNA (guanine(966)-N(2))-methyltransferase RsmD